MILEIQHETRLRYSHPVTEWQAELRVEPVSDADQSCQTFSLTLSQPAGVFRFGDGFGNRVHHFNLLAPNLEVRALAASVVETHPRPRAWAASTVPYPLDPEAFPLEVLDYVRLRGPARATEKLAPLLADLRPAPGGRVAAFILAVSRYVHEHFEYAKAVTRSSSPIDDVLALGKGVCQDFAHLVIAVLRSFGVPARYVSGYIHRPNQESQSHAWVEAWLPDLGWAGIDPTNNTPAGEHHVKVAVGRDYTDVPPNKGVYRGACEEQILARVETRQLDRLPTLSWAEQLPPLNVPLTMVLTQQQMAAVLEEDGQEQQQNQQ